MTVIAEAFCVELDQLAKTALTEGAIELIRRPWVARDFEGAAMAVADLETESEIVRFANAARAASIPINVVDSPVHCDSQFGSIVN